MASLAAAPGADAKGAAVADGERSIGIYQSAGGTSLRGPIPRPTTEADFANEALFHSWYHVPGESWEVRVGRSPSTRSETIINNCLVPGKAAKGESARTAAEKP